MLDPGGGTEHTLHPVAVAGHGGQQPFRARPWGRVQCVWEGVYMQSGQSMWDDTRSFTTAGPVSVSISS